MIDKKVTKPWGQTPLDFRQILLSRKPWKIEVFLTISFVKIRLFHVFSKLIYLCPTPDADCILPWDCLPLDC